MGLGTTHDCWQGAYSSFMRWRRMIARVAGYPPLDFMAGFWEGTEIKLSKDMAEKDDVFFDGAFGQVKRGYFHFVKGNCERHENEFKPEELYAIRVIEDLEKSLPIPWEPYRDNPLTELLFHSDCDGELRWQNCWDMALALEKLLPALDEVEEKAWGHIRDWREKTQRFIDGLKRAFIAKENVEFH